MYILALESSTTSAKAMVYDTEKNKFEVASKAFTLETNDVTLHNATSVFNETAMLGKNLCAGKKIDIVVLGGAWHSLMLCDKNMTPCTPVYLWSNTEAKEICKTLRKDETYVTNYYQKTGCMVNAIYPFFKVKYLESLGYNLKDYLLVGQGTYNTYRLTGERVIMDSMASGTGILNIHTKLFDTELLDELGLTQEQLPKVISYNEVLKLSEEGAQLLGLDKGIPVIATGPDGGYNQVGAGALEEGVMSFSVGTSGAIRLTCNKPIIPNTTSTWCYLSPKAWLSGGAVNGCCNCIDWFKQKYFPADISYSEIEKGCTNEEQTPVFLPFIFGERCPGWEDERQGAFLDIKPQHSAYDMYHAIQEGILFNLYQCYEILTEVNGNAKKVKLSGGILKSSKWTQMCADIFGIDMQVDMAEHSSLLGGVALAMEILGEIKDAKDFTADANVVIKPNKNKAKMYQEKYNRYLYWYERIK